MKFESIPVPKQTLRVRSPEWEPTQWRKDPFAGWGDEVPVQSVKTDWSRPSSFMIVAAKRVFTVVADSPAAARILSDALSSASATLARLRDRDVQGGWNLEVAFFAQRPLEFGDIQVELDEAAKSLFNSEIDYVYKAVKQNGDNAPDGNSIADSWFFIKPFYSWCEDDELKSQSPEASMDSFCVVGDSKRFVVQKTSYSTDNETKKNAGVFIASKQRRWKAERGGDRTICLVSGTLAFVRHADAIKLRAEAQLQALVRNEGSYLRNWDQYNEEEGNIQLEKARSFGAIRYENIRSSTEGDHDVTILELTGIADVVRDKLRYDNRLELELFQECPEWIVNPEWTIKQFLESVTTANNGAAADNEHATEDDSSDSQEKPEDIKSCDIEKWQFDSDSNELTCFKHIEDIPRKGFVAVSFKGFLKSIRRRDEARRRIMAGGSANPMLGTVLEASGIPEPLEKRRHVEALSVHTAKLFSKPLRDNQIAAIDIALNTPDIALIQGPPGTGKTTVITAVLDRLNELAPKNSTGKGSVLLCGFQHDAVENMIDRIRLNSLPVPKFGKKQGDEDGEASAERMRREWCEKVAANIRTKNPQLAEAEEEQRIRDLVVQYVQAPDTALARLICQAILDLPAANVSVDCKSRARQALQQLDGWRSGAEHEEVNRTLAVIRALRTTERSFRDDGPERAGDLLDEDGIQLEDAEKKLIQRAADWLEGDTIDFLDKLRALKRKLLVRFTSSPVFIVEKHSDFMLALARDTLASIREIGSTAKDRRAAALLEFVESLEGDPEGMLDAVSDYSFAIAATCQQCANWKVAEVKGVRRKGKNDTREVPPLVYDYVIIDEAARAQPLDLLIPMSQGKRVLLVGDHRQLPQMVDEDLAAKLESGACKDEISKLEDEKWWKESMFEYLFTKRIPELESRDHVTRRVILNEQFRMHPVLGQFISNNFYKRFSSGEAITSPLSAECYQHSLPVPGNGPVLWIDMPAALGPTTKFNGSRVREVEGDVIFRRINDWMGSESGKDLSFGVISFYRGQVEKLKERLGDRVDGKQLHVGTVDSFQGKEFDVVFLSLVRTSDFLNSQNPFGFLTVYNRLNVAMSRQKKLLVVVGDAAFFGTDEAHSQVPGLAAFLELCQSMNAVEECPVGAIPRFRNLLRSLFSADQ